MWFKCSKNVVKMLLFLNIFNFLNTTYLLHINYIKLHINKLQVIIKFVVVPHNYSANWIDGDGLWILVKF